ncbi:hypothetical protein TrRE_jg2931 [Triparma retinervis]|uniref:AB hydrolase-1 domain-containing protein n=1 Tax=Triparma retinervis TaxID=2557542 RepID=A0A9W6Z967_9STRA|nr:hypothetical protein TrRE_jg2931 [Triparma retinervis]
MIKSLLSSNTTKYSAIYTIDYIGQGSSWPSVPPPPVASTSTSPPSIPGVSYSLQTWISQISAFITSTVLPSNPSSGSVSICGNSLGGHISLHLARLLPSVVSSVVLFNATPIWGGTFSRVLPFWDGFLPAPPWVQVPSSYVYDAFRSDAAVEAFLKICYARHPESSGGVKGGIMDAAGSGYGHGAFASILWGESVETFFEGGGGGVDALLVYGDADPWIKTGMGREVCKELGGRGGEVGMWVVEGGGHCVQHEFGELVGKIYRLDD